MCGSDRSVRPTLTGHARVLNHGAAGVSSKTWNSRICGIASYATAIQIGNNSALRATDTLLDFVFVRPAAQIEPVVSVSRVR
jgi:hypothetical protein